MNDLIAWYQAREPREKLLITAAGSVLLLTLVFFSVVKPLINEYRSMRSNLASIKRELPWYRKTVATILQNSGQAPRRTVRSNESLQTIINRTSRLAGIGRAISRVEPHGESEALVAMQAAPFNNVIVWIERLGQQYQLEVAKITLTRANSPGLVNARITFKRN